MKKRGQVFLIAAVVIVVILVSLTVVYNIATSPADDEEVFELAEEINFEATKVLDNGVFSGDSDQDIDTRIESLVVQYTNANPDSDIIVIYGDKEGIKGIQSVCDEASFSLGSSGTTTCRRQVTTNNVDFEIIGNQAIIKLPRAEEEYVFDLRDEKNFYFVLRKVKDGEQIIQSNEK